MSAKKETKPRPGKPGSRQSGRKRAAGKKRKVKRGLSPLEAQLRKTLAEMGLSRARRVFARVEASFED